MTNRVPFFTIGLPQFPVNTDKNIEPDLRDIYNAIRNLAYQVGQYGGFEAADVGIDNATSLSITAGAYKRRVYCKALEVMPFGAIVHFFNTAGVVTARFANATNNTRPGYGINNTPGNCAIGDTIEVVLPGCYVTSIGGLAIGSRYFLSTVNGLITTVAPAVAGNIVEAIGFALAPNLLYFWPNTQWVTL